MSRETEGRATGPGLVVPPNPSQDLTKLAENKESVNMKTIMHMDRESFRSEHWNDDNGNPAGGCSTGRGFTISWQNGPLGRNGERKEPNGAFVEDVLGAALDRLQWYNEGKFASEYNTAAINHVIGALTELAARTANRESRQVEGIHAL